MCRHWIPLENRERGVLCLAGPFTAGPPHPSAPTVSASDHRSPRAKRGPTPLPASAAAARMPVIDTISSCGRRAMTHSPAGSRIVVGIDGSAASDAAVRWAVREARLRHATVHLVSAYYSDRSLRAQYVPPSSWMTPEHDRRAAGALLAAAVDIARRYLSTARLMAEVANEPPVRALLDRSAHAELLVLGTTRPRPQPGQPPQAMGPVARPCLRMAHCPVVVVSPEDLPAGGTTAGYASRMRRPARRPGSAARQHRLAGRRAGARYSPADAPQPEIAAKDLSPGPVADVRDRSRLDRGYVDVHPGHWL